MAVQEGHMTSITKIHPKTESDRERIHNEMTKLIEKLRPYYEEEKFNRLDDEIEHVRHGDKGAVGDMSVIIWAGGQLAMYRALEG